MKAGLWQRFPLCCLNAVKWFSTPAWSVLRYILALIESIRSLASELLRNLGLHGKGSPGCVVSREWNRRVVSLTTVGYWGAILATAAFSGSEKYRLFGYYLGNLEQLKVSVSHWGIGQIYIGLGERLLLNAQRFNPEVLWSFAQH